MSDLLADHIIALEKKETELRIHIARLKAALQEIIRKRKLDAVAAASMQAIARTALEQAQMNDRLTPRPNLIHCTDEEKVERMVKWFFENYEDAAERTPYETAEGGYQYIWGGPYDARETLEEMFVSVADDLIHRAAARIEDDGDDWVPVPHPSDYE